MGKREYFPAFFSYKRTLKGLTDEQMGRVFRAALEYAESGAEPELEPMEMLGFAFMREDIDRANESYEELCAKNKANRAQVGQRPSTTVNDGQRPSTVVDDGNESESESERKAKEYNTVSDDTVCAPVGAKHTAKKRKDVPENVAEVQAFIDENHLDVDAERFWDYYAAQGWLLSTGRVMKDWKAACRNWHRRGQSNPRAAPRQQSADPVMEFLDRVIAGDE